MSDIVPISGGTGGAGGVDASSVPHPEPSTATGWGTQLQTSVPRNHSEAQPFDVWSKWGSRYRVRASLLLLINVVLFCGLAIFAYWVRSGVWFAPSMTGYWYDIGQALDFRSGEVTLRGMLLRPISIQEAPLQILILGLLLAALIAIPIIVSILYRFWAAVPFILLVAFVAMMPWLAVTLIASCIVASVRPFRTTIPFVSALVGLVPASIYLVRASSSRATEEIMGTLEPIESMKFIAPWVLAIVASAAVFAVVLSLARLVNYRPGAVTPLLAVMFGIPVGLFEYSVGRDELRYRLIESRQAYYFGDRRTHLDVRAAIEEEYRNHPVPRPPKRQVEEEVSRCWIDEITPDLGGHRELLRGRQDGLVTAWHRFMHDFPDSRYRFNALFLEATALDTRLDAVEFERSSRRWIRCYSDFPSRDSEDIWKRLTEAVGDSKIGAVAHLRVAQLEARDGAWQRALARLDRLLRTFDTGIEPPGVVEPVSRRRRIFDRPPPESSLAISIETVVFEARCLRDLLAANDDPVNSYEPLCGSASAARQMPDGLLDFDPRSDGHVKRLRRLAAIYPGCRAQDNIELEIVKASELPLSERIERYQELLLRYDGGEPRPSTDAVPEMLFRLALACRDDGRVEESRRMLERLLREHPDSVWARQATNNTGVHRLVGAKP